MIEAKKKIDFHLPGNFTDEFMKYMCGSCCLPVLFFNPTLNIKMVCGEKIPKMGTFSDFVTIFFVKCYNKI